MAGNCTTDTSPAATRAETTRRRLDVVARTITARAQLVVGGAFLGVAQRLVSLVDRLELLLGARLLAHVGMELARQPPIRGLDLGFASAGFDPEDGVVVLELHRPLLDGLLRRHTG